MMSDVTGFHFLSCRKQDGSPAESAAILQEVEGLEVLLSRV